MLPPPYWRLSGFYFCYFAFLSAFGPYFSLYLDALGLAAAKIGVLMSLGPVARIFAPYLWGWLADRSGRRMRIARLGAAASVLAFSGVFAGTSFGWLAAVLGLLALVQSSVLPIAEANTLNHLGERTERYGRIRLWGSIGYIAAALGVGYALDVLPVAHLRWIVLALLAATALCCWQVPEARVAAPVADGVRFRDIWTGAAVTALLAACFLMAVAHGPYYTFFSLYLVEHGYSKAAVGWLWSLGVIAEIGVFAFMPRLFGAFEVRAILIASFALAGVRFVIIGWLIDSLVLLLLAQLLHAASFGSFHAAALAAVHRLFRGRHQTRGQALYTSVTFGAGGALGGLYSGYSWSALGAAATFGIAAACAFAGAALLAWKLRLPRPA
ncbi:MAG TPA: MFS transporter [Burkholderiales bacterium]|nr:MFS transporter [Burkholderiales bacterium]